MITLRQPHRLPRPVSRVSGVPKGPDSREPSRLSAAVGVTGGRVLPVAVVALWSALALFGGGRVDSPAEGFYD